MIKTQIQIQTEISQKYKEPENPRKRVDQLFEAGTDILAGEAVDKKVERAGDEDDDAVDDVDDDGEEDQLSLLTCVSFLDALASLGFMLESESVSE